MLEGILHIAHFPNNSMKLRGVAVTCIKGHISKTQVLELGAHIFKGSLRLRVQGMLPVELLRHLD